MTKILILGSGYVGLCTGVVFAKSNKVTLVDVDQRKVDLINQSIPPIHEEGLEEALKRAIDSGNLKAVHASHDMEAQDVVMICVGTPSNPDGTVNLEQISEAINWFISNSSRLVADKCFLIIKSTVPPGTNDKYATSRIQKEGLSGKVLTASMPEFLREGSAIRDTENPDRIVIGAKDEETVKKLIEMHSGCLTSSPQFVQMTPASAEFCKYVSNCFLATKISFSNEIANLVETVPDADIDQIMEGVGMDKRISPMFFGAGAGFGGSCFPKDTIGLVRFAEVTQKVSMPILSATLQVNEARPARLTEMLQECIGQVSGKKVAVLGLAFKPGTDDTRESPSFKVIQQLHLLGADVYAHDPLSQKMNLQEMAGKAHIVSSVEECLRNADACLLLTAWPEYVAEGLESLTGKMRQKVFIDGRRAFVRHPKPTDLKYRAIGTKSDCM